MKKWLLWLLIAVVVMLSSIIIRINKIPVLIGFKHESIQPHENDKRDFYLYFFFSIRDCNPCLDSIEIIKKYSSIFRVIGVIPDSEIKEIDFIKREFGIDFNIVSANNVAKYKPVYSPSMMGVNDAGKIYFIIPIVTDYYEYVESFILRFLERYNLINQ